MIDYKSVGLSEEDLKEIYKWMDLGRKVDERLWLLNRAGKIPFVVSGQGQEATQIGMAYAMKEGDISSPYYRDLAFVTFMGISPYDTMLASFGKKMILIPEENKCLPTLVIVKRAYYHKVLQLLHKYHTQLSRISFKMDKNQILLRQLSEREVQIKEIFMRV